MSASLRATCGFAVALALAMCATGCTRQDINNAGNAIASAAPGIASDGVMLAQIEASFVRIDADSALHVAVASHQGNVRLSGRAKTSAIVAQFVDAAKHTSGVKAVTSTVVADARTPSTKKAVADFALVAAVRANLVAHSGVDALGVGIAASSGAVALHGHVPSAAVRTTMLDAARATTGVTSVDDKLAVAP